MVRPVAIIVIKLGARPTVNNFSVISTGLPPFDNGVQEARLYRIVAERIQALIQEEHLGAGARLPSERDLAARLNISRSSLREGLIALELTGVVEVRVGSGVYVSEKPATAPVLSEAGGGPFEVLSARRLIEGEIAAIAARLGTDGAIDAILKAADEMERQQNDRKHNDVADRKFHLAIASATGNSALVAVVNNLWDQRGGLWMRMEDYFHTDQMHNATLGDHRAIAAAIAAHDPAGARRAMRGHLERVAREFSRGWGVKSDADSTAPGTSKRTPTRSER
jgi:GntR family uxuAB operon transcriptional repressor